MLRIVLTVIQVLTALFLICVVLLQSGKNAGLSGAIAGAADSFMSKNKATTWDAKLARPPSGWRPVHHPDPGTVPDPHRCGCLILCTYAGPLMGTGVFYSTGLISTPV